MTPERKLVLQIEGAPRRYLHFSGTMWTENRAWAWVGTRDQLVRLLAEPRVARIADMRAKAVYVKVGKS